MTNLAFCSRTDSRRQASAGAGKSGSQARITCDPAVVIHPFMNDHKVHNSLDFLKVSFGVDWSDFVLLDKLDRLKEKMQATEFEDEYPIEYMHFHWNLSRTGIRSYPYKLSAGDVVLFLSRRSAESRLPTCRLEIGSLTSQTYVYQMVRDVKYWLGQIGGQIKSEKIAEVHFGADFIGMDLRSLPLHDEDFWIHNSTKFSINREHRKYSGISIGKGNIMLRVYDKVLELKRSKHKQEVFAELWGVSSYDEKPVTRIEYQVRRPVLKEFWGSLTSSGVTTISDLVECLNALWQYCTKDWSRFTETVVDRKNKNHQRADVSWFWNIVQYTVWTGNEQLIRERPTKHKDIESLRAQARGILMSVAAFYVFNLEDVEEIILRCQEYIEKDLREFSKDSKAFLKKMQEKRNAVFLETVPF